MGVRRKRKVVAAVSALATQGIPPEKKEMIAETIAQVCIAVMRIHCRSAKLNEKWTEEVIKVLSVSSIAQEL